jgi:hypothetical protein
MHIFFTRHYFVADRKHWVVDCFDYKNNVVLTRRFCSEPDALRFIDKALVAPIIV